MELRGIQSEPYESFLIEIFAGGNMNIAFPYYEYNQRVEKEIDYIHIASPLIDHLF